MSKIRSENIAKLAALTVVSFFTFILATSIGIIKMASILILIPIAYIKISENPINCDNGVYITSVMSVALSYIVLYTTYPVEIINIVFVLIIIVYTTYLSTKLTNII